MKTEQFDPIIPISGKQLAKRWGIDVIDIFFVMLNHDLGVLGYYGNRAGVDIIIDATLQSGNKDLDPEKWAFALTDVQKLEKEELAAFFKNREKLIRGKALLKK